MNPIPQYENTANAWTLTLVSAEPGRHYIYSEGDQVDHAPVEQLTPERRKLSVDEIVNYSSRIIGQLERHRDENPERVNELERRIIDNTNNIITARANKRAHNGTLNFWRTFTGVLSFIGIGLPFWVGIKIADNKFNNEIASLRGRILPVGVNPPPPRPATAPIPQNVQDVLKSPTGDAANAVFGGGTPPPPFVPGQENR